MPQNRPAPAKPLIDPAPDPLPKRQTLEQLFETEESMLLGFAHRFVRRREIAEDLVQEAFMRLHRHWADVEHPRAWIYRATRNLCLSWIRDNKREVLMEDGEDQTTPDTEGTRPDSALLHLEVLGNVSALVADLDETERQLVQLKYHEGLRYTDIAERTGLTVSNVGYKLHHILKGLASTLRQSGIHHSNT